MKRIGRASIAALILISVAGLVLNPQSGVAQGCVWERREDGERYIRELHEDLDRLMRHFAAGGSMTDRWFRRLVNDKRLIFHLFPALELEGEGATIRFDRLFEPLEMTDFWLEYALLRDALSDEEAGGSPTVRIALFAARGWLENLDGIEELPNATTRRLRAMNHRLEELTEDYLDGGVDHARLRREIDAIVDLKKEIINAIGPVFRADDGSPLITFRTLYRLLERIDFRIAAAGEPQVFRSKSRIEWVAEAKLYVERLEARLREGGCLGEPEPSPSPTESPPPR